MFFHLTRGSIQQIMQDGGCLTASAVWSALWHLEAVDMSPRVVTPSVQTGERSVGVLASRKKDGGSPVLGTAFYVTTYLVSSPWIGPATCTQKFQQVICDYIWRIAKPMESEKVEPV